MGSGRVLKEDGTELDYLVGNSATRHLIPGPSSTWNRVFFVFTVASPGTYRVLFEGQAAQTEIPLAAPMLEKVKPDRKAHEYRPRPFSGTNGAPTSYQKVCADTDGSQFREEALQAYLSCPSEGVWSGYLGQVDLTHLYLNAWNTVEILLPVHLRDALESDANDCSLKLTLNVHQGLSMWHIDRIGFTD